MLEIIDQFVVNKFDLIDKKMISMPNLGEDSIAEKDLVSISEPSDTNILPEDLTSISRPAVLIS